MKRWRPRARGRATRIRKRTCHITVVVTRLPEDRLARRQARDTGDAAGRRARRVAGARKRAVAQAPAPEGGEEAAPVAEVPEEATPEAEAPQEEAVEPAGEAEAAQDEAPEPEGDEVADDGGQENDEKEKRK
jgi:large subunit ribosomal protein L22